MKTLLTLCLATALLSSCSKEHDPQPAAPDPAPTLTVTRTMTYATAPSRDNGVTYTQKTLDGSGTLTDTGLKLLFSEQNAPDDLAMEVPKAALTNALNGTYALNTRTNPSGVADVRYIFTRINTPGQTSGVIVGKFSLAGGQLVVTQYDSERRLVSGSFEVRYEDLADPTDGRFSDSDKLHCTLKMVGSFNNLKLR